MTVSATPVSSAFAADFGPKGATLTVEPGETRSRETLTITATLDGIHAPNTTVEVTGSVTAGRVRSSPEARSLTITEEDLPPVVTLALSKRSIEEGGDASEVTAELSEMGSLSSAPVTVTVTVTPDSPATAADFLPPGETTLTIAPGDRASPPGRVRIVSSPLDGIHAPDKTLTVSGLVSGGNGVVEDPATETLTITEEDLPPVVTLALSKRSIEEGGDASEVTAELSEMGSLSSAPVTVTVTVTPDSPATAADFLPPGETTLTIAPGDRASPPGRVRIVSSPLDGIHAPDKTLTVSGLVSGGNGVVEDPATETLTITEEDLPPVVTLALSKRSIEEGGDASEVTAELSEMGSLSSAPVTVTVTVTPDSPATAADFLPPGETTLTIAPGDRASPPGRVRIVSSPLDGIHAPDKTLTVSGLVSGGNNGVVEDPATETLTITEEDLPPVVTLALSKRSIEEGGDASEVTAELSEMGSLSSAPVTVTVTVTPDSPATAADFLPPGETTLTIAPGDRASPPGRVRIVSSPLDGIHAPDKTLTVSGLVSGGNNGVVEDPATETLTITEEDLPPVVTLALSKRSIEEGGDASEVTAELSEMGSLSSAPVTVTVTVTPDSPATAADFLPPGETTLTIAPGDRASPPGRVRIVSSPLDGIHAPDKTLTVSGLVSGGNGVVEDPATETLTITEEDRLPEVTLELDPPSIEEDGGGSVVRARLSGPSSAAVTVTVTVTPNSPATAADFAQRGTLLTIAEGATASTGTVRIEATNNDIDGPDKTFEVTGSVAGRPRRSGSGVADADDHRRRADAGGDAGSDAGVDLGRRRREPGDGAAERRDERGSDAGGDGVGRLRPGTRTPSG